MTVTGDGTGDDLWTIGSSAVRVFGGRLVKLVVGLLNQVIMARLLTPADYGAVVIAQLAVGVGSILAVLGLQNGLTRYVPYYEDDPTKLRSVVRSGLGIGLLSGAVAGAGLFAAAPTVALRVFDEPTLIPLLWIAAVAIPFGVLSHVAAAVARGAEVTSVRVGVRQLLNPLTRLVLVTTLLLAGFGAAGAIASLAATLVVGSLVSLWLALRALPVSLRGPTVPMARELLAFSLPLLFAVGLEFLVANTDTFLVGFFLSSGAVGAYNVAFRFRTLGMLFFHPIAFLLPTVLTRLDRDGERRALGRTYQVATKWMMLSTTPVVLLLVLFPGVVIEVVFGAEYLQGAPALRILALSVLVTVLLGANGAALVALGHNRVHLYVNAGVAVANLVLNLVLIPHMGILGAAVASTVAFVGRDVAYTAVLYRREGVHPLSASMLRPLLVVLVGTAGGYAVFVRTVAADAVSVAAAGVLFIVLYVPAIVALGAVDREDRQVLEQVEATTDVNLAPLRTALGWL